MNVWILVAGWVGLSVPVALGVGAVVAGAEARRVRPAVVHRRPAPVAR